jgi:hypothetical protein
LSKFRHQTVHKFGDFLGKRVIGLNIFIKSVDDEGREGGVVLGKKQDEPPQLVVGTEGDNHVFDEVIAIIKAFFFEELTSRIMQFHKVMVVGSHQVLDLSFELHLFLLFFFDQKKLFFKSSLEIC